MSVSINGQYEGHGVSHPREIIKLFRPLKFCTGKPVNYSFAAWTDYLNDIEGVIGSLVFIATKDDLPNFTSQSRPFIYIHSQFANKEAEIVEKAKMGEKFSLDCGCEYEVVPLDKFPKDEIFDFVITGHNVDER